MFDRKTALFRGFVARQNHENYAFSRKTTLLFRLPAQLNRFATLLINLGYLIQ